MNVRNSSGMDTSRTTMLVKVHASKRPSSPGTPLRLASIDGTLQRQEDVQGGVFQKGRSWWKAI